MKPEEYFNRLLEITQSKYNLLKDILALSLSQNKMLTEDGLESLNTLIEAKQAKIDGINKLDEEFEVYFKRLKTVMNIKNLQEIVKPGPEGAAELQETVRQVMSLVEEINEIEKENNTRAKSLLEELGGKVRNLNRGRQINSAYRPEPIRPPSYFLDKKK